MLAVILINVLLTALVLVTIVGAHLWAILGPRGPKGQPVAAPRAAAPNRSRRPQPARVLTGVSASR